MYRRWILEFIEERNLLYFIFKSFKIVDKFYFIGVNYIIIKYVKNIIDFNTLKRNNLVDSKSIL